MKKFNSFSRLILLALVSIFTFQGLVFSMEVKETPAAYKPKEVKVMIVNYTDDNIKYSRHKGKFQTGSGNAIEGGGTDVILNLISDELGYEKLELSDEHGKLIDSYTPSGKNERVTLLVKRKDEKYNVEKYIGYYMPIK